MKQSDSATDRFGLIGFPIEHSLSPSLFKAAYSGKYQYDLIQTDDFATAWEYFKIGYKAINITAPFKANAFQSADIISDEVRKCEASNLCIKTDEGIIAYNSDFRGVKSILSECSRGSVAVIGYGGAGKAALAAARDLELESRLYRHDEITDGVNADIIIYTLPRKAEGVDRLECDILLEANYKNPCLDWHSGYISGKRWLLMQAVTGYELMTGETPDSKAMEAVLL